MSLPLTALLVKAPSPARSPFLAQVDVTAACLHLRVVTVCAAYTGETCKLCGQSFYRLGAACVPCPSNAYLLIVTYAAVLGGWLLNTARWVPQPIRFCCQAKCMSSFS